MTWEEDRGERGNQMEEKLGLVYYLPHITYPIFLTPYYLVTSYYLTHTTYPILLAPFCNWTRDSIRFFRWCRYLVVFDPPLKVIRGSINLSPGPQYAIRNDPTKLKANTKHRLLMLNACNSDEYFHNTPRTSSIYLHRPHLVRGPQI